MTSNSLPTQMIDVAAIAEAFLRQQIPAVEWTHHTHLAVGLWHVRTYPFYDAMCRMKAGIILLNTAQGTPNTIDRGYHETLTCFWLKVLDTWSCSHGDLSLDTCYQALLSSPGADKNLPKAFFTEEELRSPQSRAFFIQPTKMELTTAALSTALGLQSQKVHI